MHALSENGIGYNPEFLRKVREKQRAAKIEAARAEAREQQLLEKIATAKAKLEHEERERQNNAHTHFIEYNVIPFGRKNARLIARQIAAHAGYSFEHIKSDSRMKDLVKVRDACIRAVADARPDMSLVAIGRVFDRDHTTIMHSLRKTKKPGQPR